jgi:hypothetical protein
MNRTGRLIKYIVFIYLLLAEPAWTQFYNGLQTSFGKNRVQYNGFYWSYYRFDRFDTYFNELGRPIADYTAEFAEKELTRLENVFDYQLEKRIIFIIYNKMSDFRQSNIGLISGSSDNNIGGVTKIDKNKVFLFFEGDHRKYEQQISEAITEVLINEIIYGMDFKTNITNSTLISLPDWYIQGLVAYVSKGWNFETENRVKDGIQSKKYRKFNRLIGEDAVYAGHSFWRFIAETYGETVIPSILYLTKVNKSANIGFLYVVGSSIKDLSRDYYDYYQRIYSSVRTDDISSEGVIRKKPNKKQVYQHIKVNPNGKYLAYTTNQMGRYKIWIQDLKTGKRKRILKREHKLEQITDYSYPVMAWHPSGRILTFITEEKGGLKLYYYTFGQKKLDVRNLLYFEKILDFSFSDDGSLLVLSAVKHGQSDIFVHNLAAGTNYQVTNDLADDFSPRFINNSSQIIFSSDRHSDSLSIASSERKLLGTTDLFIYDYANKSDLLMRLNDSKHINKIQAIETSRNRFLSLSDRSGIINRYSSKFDSTINFVDTTIHYRYYAQSWPLTNYPRNIIEHDYNQKANTVAEIVYKDGRYYMYNRPFEESDNITDEIPLTEFRTKQTEKLKLKDSLQIIQTILVPIDSVKDNALIVENDTIHFDQTTIDINNYVFEIERINTFNNKLKEDNLNIQVVEKLEPEEEKKVRIYQKAFYQNYIVNQIDFSFLSESYQAFTGGAVYYNPGMNILTKVGTNDLFEDYKITGGFRLPLDFQSSEYLLSFEDLKKRLDKQIVFHRQTFKNFTGEQNSTLTKSITNELALVLRYPFSQVTSWVNTFGVRNDKTIYLTDYNNLVGVLNTPTIFKLWGRFKTEYIFDNTRSLGKNLYGGSKFKMFGEYYQQVNGSYRNLFVLGGDFRHYIVIHRNLIWANRFATSTSFGSGKIIYYLGGVDNWTNFTPYKNPTFIPLTEIRIDESQNYEYQAVATNMRGFSQNIRNGNNFAVINSEIRWPIISYLANYPISNAFLQNFQVVGFFDIGTAWSGKHPWAGKNAYETDVIPEGSSKDDITPPVIIQIDADRDPLVAGYGFGLRSQLLGYFVRLDWAWGIENMQVLPRIFYFSLSLDF